MNSMHYLKLFRTAVERNFNTVLTVELASISSTLTLVPARFIPRHAAPDRHYYLAKPSAGVFHADTVSGFVNVQ